MKKFFNHTKKPYEEWEPYYDEGEYDWDAIEEQEYEAGEELYAEDEEAYYAEEEETEALYAEDEKAYYAEEEETEALYAEDEEAYYAEDEETEALYAEDEEAYYAEEEETEALYAEDEEAYYAEEEETEALYAEDEEAYYAEEEETEALYAEDEEAYYAEEEETEALYAEEDEEAYYAEEEETEALYAEEDEEAYYAEDEETEALYAEEDEEAYYAEEDEMEPLYIEENEETYYRGKSLAGNKTLSSSEKIPKKKSPVQNAPKQNVFAVLWEKFLDMAAMDRIITVTGVAVLILALVTGSVYVGTRFIDSGLSELADVGSQLENINLIGEKGLLAVADAQIARQAAADVVADEEEQKEYNEAEYGSEVTVKLEMTSVMKDLKIKFTNKKTGKLVANVPFAVTLTTPKGKSETWTDDDMDGIIYKKNISPGTYSVAVNALKDEKYKDYTLPAEAQSVEVKKDIAYDKIDVSNEVKKESEIDVSKEDTKLNDTVVESALQDTVPWVESTAVAETYSEVAKNTIPDPLTFAMSRSFQRMAKVPDTSTSGGDAGELENKEFQLAVNPVTVAAGIGQTATAKATATGFTTGKTLKYEVVSGNTAIATAVVDASGNITVTGVAAGTATVTVKADYAEGKSVPATAVLTVTVKDKPVITLDKTTLSVFQGTTASFTATLTNGTTGAAVTAVSSKPEIASVTVSGSTVTVTGVAAGDTVITVKYTENGQEVQAVCNVTVKGHPKDNRTDRLKDSKGNQLYVLENDKYREAVYADYYTAAKFFIKGETKYTGWQTIDGHVYFFTAAGQKVTGEQVIQGAKYNFASDGSLVTGSGTMGIDVSKWNGNIDWNAVKNSGVSYVIIRCGYRGSSQGMLIEDPKFNANIKGATAAGLKVGVYFFTQATDEIEAVEEASYVLGKIKNYKISYPVFLDVESSGGRGDKIDKGTRTAVIKAFCETIQRNGYTAGVYANKTWLTQKFDANSLSAYKIWLAQYASAPTYKGRYDLWQYKSTGRVSGISGNVDLNLSYLGY